MTVALIKNLGDVIHKKGWQEDVLPSVGVALQLMTSLADLSTLCHYAQALQSALTTNAALHNKVNIYIYSNGPRKLDLMMIIIAINSVRS
jgi:hypothetical protein